MASCFSLVCWYVCTFEHALAMAPTDPDCLLPFAPTHRAAAASSSSSSAASSSNNNNNSTGPHTASEALVEEVLTRVASLHGMAPRTLKRLPRGGQRRGLHDDVCVTVVRFDWGQQE